MGTGPILLSVLFGLLLGHMWLAYWGPIEDLGIWMDCGHVLCTSTGNCQGGHDLHASKHTSARVGMPSLYCTCMYRVLERDGRRVYAALHGQLSRCALAASKIFGDFLGLSPPASPPFPSGARTLFPFPHDQTPALPSRRYRF